MSGDLQEVVVARLRSADIGTPRKIADATGMAYDTVLRIKRGDTEDPRQSTLRKIAEWFALQDRQQEASRPQPEQRGVAG